MTTRNFCGIKGKMIDMEDSAKNDVKLPEVGKIYKSLILKYKIEVIKINQKWQSIKYKYIDDPMYFGEMDFEEFFKYFKELT